MPSSEKDGKLSKKIFIIATLALVACLVVCVISADDDDVRGAKSDDVEFKISVTPEGAGTFNYFWNGGQKNEKTEVTITGYKVHYESVNSELLFSSSKEIDWTYGVSYRSTNQGYSFAGWTYTDNRGVEVAINKGDVIEKDDMGNYNIHAKWNPNQYTVTFNQHDPTISGTNQIKPYYNANLPNITVPQKTGYTFGGYWTGENGTGTKYYNVNGTPAVQKWNIANNTTLHAMWVANSYSVTLNANGGSTAGSTTATYDSNTLTNTTHATPSTGYELTGYYTAATGGEKVITSSGELLANVDGYTDADKKWKRAEDTTLYAHWDYVKYTVTFTVNDTALGNVDSASKQIPYNSTYVATSTTEKGVTTGTITFTTPANETITVTVTATSVNLTSWFKQWNNGGSITTSGTITGETSFTAILDGECTVTVAKNHDALGTLSSETVTVPYKSTYTTTVATTQGTVTFSDSQSITATPLSQIAGVKNCMFYSWSPTSGTILSNGTITANFFAECDVSIESSNSELGTVSPSTITVPYGSVITADNNVITFTYTPTEFSYSSTATINSIEGVVITFENWSTSSGNVTQGMTITANFKGLCTITVVSNDTDLGTVSASTVTVLYGSTITTIEEKAQGKLTFPEGSSVSEVIATPHEAGKDYYYFFENWNIPSTTVKTSFTVTANFEKELKQYKITFIVNNTDYGKVDAEDSFIHANYGTTVTVEGNKMTFNDPKAGLLVVTAIPNENTPKYVYSFTAWGEFPATIDGDISITVTFDRETNRYVVYFESDDVIVHQETIDYGDTVDRYDVAKEGYIFLGWYDGDALWNFDTPIVDETHLVAKWEKIESVIVVIETDDDGNAEVQVPTDGTVEDIVIINEKDSMALTIPAASVPKTEERKIVTQLICIGEDDYEVTVEYEDKEAFHGSMIVTLPFDSKKGSPLVYWVIDGNYVQMMTTVDFENGLISFETDHNSEYIVTYVGVPAGEIDNNVLYAAIGIVVALIAILGIGMYAYRH